MTPHLFNINIDYVMRIFKNKTKPGINLGNIMFNNILFADNLFILRQWRQIITKNFYSKKIGKNYNFKISKNKRKVMTFKGKNPIKIKNILKKKLSRFHILVI